jgi:hypothetical protein
MPICVVKGVTAATAATAATAEGRRYRRGEHARDMDERLEKLRLERRNEESGVDADLRCEEGCCCWC